VTGCTKGEVEINPLFRFEEEHGRDGKVGGRLVATGNPLVHTRKWRLAGLSFEPETGRISL